MNLIQAIEKVAAIGLTKLVVFTNALWIVLCRLIHLQIKTRAGASIYKTAK